ncbi:T9SS type A sorting domain-containing protein [Algoriphagus confluentis]|uniref:Secretion system C-terminal sorting domain-containing protein n=1 Tax=Algoriphagus confluentis TaxID=1697556 RepID=A0ABQ6PQS6_9BACT|nr:hypothetical protein Aconfl_22530 [Algoriphagus confluentis]
MIFFLLSTRLVLGQTWTGITSSNWNTASNWSSGTIPGAGSDVVISNPAAPNQPILPGNISLRDFSISAGNINLGGFQLTVTRNFQSTGGTISNGTVAANNLNSLQNTVFNGTITLIKTGGINNTSEGGNVFNGPTTIRNNNNSRWRLANTLGDRFNSTSQFIKGSTGDLQIAFNGINEFNGTITLESLNNNNTLSFGLGGGTSVLNVGGLINGSFSVGNLDIRNFTQVQVTANGVFDVDDFFVTNSVFLGDFSVTTADDLIFLGNNIFNGVNSFISGGNLDADGLNQFSIPLLSSTTFVKNGNGNDDWEGGNTFGTVSFTNNSNSRLRLANTLGDSFLRTSIFSNNGTNFLGIAYSGSTTFGQQIEINNSNPAGSVRFGEGGGTSLLSTGAVVTSLFGAANILEFNNFIQVQNVANGNFNSTTFTSINSSFQGDFGVNATTINFNGANTFARNGNFTGNSIQMTGAGNNFASSGGVARFIKNASGINNDWNGGTTFGTLEITNNANSRLRLGQNLGDTFNSSSVFTNNGNGILGIAFRGTNSFSQQITINNTSAGGTLRFGEGGGTSTLSNGGVVTSSFTTGNLLEFNNFSQTQNFPNGNFQVTTFTSVNSSFQGDFGVTATTINFNGANVFARNGTFSGGSIQMTAAGNSFATSGGTIRFIKTTSGTNNDWNGGNTFGRLEVFNTTNSRLRLGQNTGDTFTSTSLFTNTGNGILGVAFRGTNTFAEQITLNNSGPNGTLRFGEGGGTSSLQTGGVLTSDFMIGNLLEFNNFTQVQNASNGNFGVTTFNSINSSFQGDFGVTATSVISFQGSNTFANNGDFTAPNINANGANNFSTVGGIANFTKTGGGSNDWAGGNTFGLVNFVNSSGSRFRLAVTSGDSFTRDASFVSTSTGLIEPAFNHVNTFSGNISTVGSSRALTFGSNNGTVEITGNTAQVWQGDAAFSPTVRRLRMNTPGNLTLAVPLLVNVFGDFSNGILNTSLSNLLTFDNGATSSGMSDASHVDGPVRKIGNQAFTFPTGDGGFFAPISMANRGGGGTDIYTAQYLQVAPVDIPTDTTARDATIGLMNRTEHWDLRRNVGSINRGISLSYDGSRTSPIIDHTELVSIYWNGSSWVDLMGAVSGNASSGTITAGTTSNLGWFSIGSSFRVLPVELLSFTARQTENRDILVEWQTATEKNNSHFLLERSFDGKKWETLSLVPGSGDSLEPLSYRFVDINPKFGRNFYRLIQVDFDGLSTIYQTVAVSVIGENNPNLQIKVFPNPTQGKVYLESQNLNLDGMKVDILNLNGQSVLQSDEIRNSQAEFDLSGLPKGLYILMLYSAKEIHTKKLILQ